jgi:P-type conjugative transfer protein TrbJ
MRKLSTFPLVILPAALLLVPAEEARAQFWNPLAASEITQLLNHAQLLSNYIKEAQTALNAVQMAQMMTQEGIQLAQHPSTNILADISSFGSILQQSRGLALDFAQMDNQFRAVYVPFASTGTQTYATAYNTWSDTALKTIQGVANTAGMQGNSLANDQQFMARIQALMVTPQGRNQSLQLGVSVGTETVAQLMKLRALFAADMAAKAAISAQQINTQQAQIQAATSGFGDPSSISADTRAW